MRSFVLALCLCLSLSATLHADDKPAPAVKPRTLAIAIGQTVRLQMTSKQPIRKVFNERDDVALVKPMTDDPTTVLVTGVGFGRTRITLTDADGKEETRSIGK